MNIEQILNSYGWYTLGNGRVSYLGVGEGAPQLPPKSAPKE